MKVLIKFARAHPKSGGIKFEETSNPKLAKYLAELVGSYDWNEAFRINKALRMLMIALDCNIKSNASCMKVIYNLFKPKFEGDFELSKLLAKIPMNTDVDSSFIDYNGVKMEITYLTNTKGIIRVRSNLGKDLTSKLLGVDKSIIKPYDL